MRKFAPFSKTMVQIRIINQSGLSLPAYQTEHSAGLDLCACLEEPVVIAAGHRQLIGTGLFMALPSGFEAQIRPRSGLALKHGITLLNTPGTIDADYRGEIKVLLINLGHEPFLVNHGDRIAQMVVARYEKVEWQLTEELDETVRGAGGYGHTGIKP